MGSGLLATLVYHLLYIDLFFPLKYYTSIYKV